MPASALIFAKKDYVGRDGRVPLYLRLTINKRPQNPIPLDKRVDPRYWDDAHREAKPGFDNYQKLNVLLHRIQARADEIILDHELTGRPLSLESFKKELAGLSPYDYYDLVTAYCKNLRGSCSYEYIEKVGHVTNKLRDFSPVLDLQQIDYNFLKRYRHYLATVRGNGKNTIHSNMRIIRRILKDALRQKLIKENPFDNFPLEKVKVQKEVLDLQELKRYEDILHGELLPYLRKTLCWFLLAVYTGRRYQDIQKFYEWEFFDDHARIVQMKRTNNRDERKVTTLYLNNRIRAIVEDIRRNKYLPLSNTQANKFLKQLNDIIGVTKKIRFHSARHTFSYINKKLTSDLSVRKELLGHDSINSTMIYDHPDEELQIAAMKKWDAILPRAQAAGSPHQLYISR